MKKGDIILNREQEELFNAAHEYGENSIKEVVESHGGPEKCFVRPDAADYIMVHFADGAIWAFKQIEKQIDFAAYSGYKFPILHLRDFIDKTLGRK